MNNGAFIFQKDFFNSNEMQVIIDLAKSLEYEKSGVHAVGKYSDLKWFKVDLSPELDFCKKILTFLKADDPELLVFYYLDPGAKIHPHRDLTGAGLNNRIRFHVPVVTNSNVSFVVHGDVVEMKPGDLWCLDTSYVHSVENAGNESRIHIVIECAINDEIAKKVPNDFQAKIHNLNYVAILVFSFGKALLINSIRDPKYLVSQIKMIFRFIGWRFLGLSKPK